MRQADLRTKQFTYDGLMTYNMLCQAYGKVGNGSEVVTGNRNWKWKMEKKKKGQSLVQCFLHKVHELCACHYSCNVLRITLAMVIWLDL